jgi:hypothetical protein
MYLMEGMPNADISLRSVIIPEYFLLLITPHTRLIWQGRVDT